MTSTQTAPAHPLIEPTPPAGEEGRVNDVFAAVESHLGFVPDALRLYGISPPLLEAFVGNVSYFRGGTSLSPMLTTMIRYLVSVAGDCRFCIDMNEGFLLQMGLDLEHIRAGREDVEQAPVHERERPLLRLALRSTTEPQAITAADLDACRVAGFSDREIFDAVAQATSNRALNLMLATFKVEEQGAFL
ncbi:hypothetical protein [Thiohalocapsa sp.]|uniref:carboxymuconolactone decarboxylase family protein n=1 Tax=Thiohalocapsa sp. TaxID=2497641 RepID=UPI0025DBEAB7|nr:hypothetical protein [Thiohalocapsa sp.]